MTLRPMTGSSSQPYKRPEAGGGARTLGLWRSDMAGCGELPGGGRRPNMEEEEADGRSVEMPPVPADQEGPESSDDPSAADSKENLEFSPEENQACMRTVFTEEQLTTLEALFEKNRYQTRKERKQLANQLSLPERTIQTWFINQRMRRKTPKKFDPQGPESSDDPSAAHNKENPEYLLEKIQEQKHKRFTEEQLNTLEACFKEEPNPTPTERKKLANKLSVLEEKIKSWYRYQRKKLKHQAPSPKKTPIPDHAGYSKPPTEAPQDLQHEQKMDARIKCVQAQKQLHLDSFPPPQPMDSCVLPQVPHSPVRVSCQNVDRPPGSSVTTDLISYDGPSTSSAPSTSKMPITQDNVDEESSTDCSLVIDEDATYSD